MSHQQYKDNAEVWTCLKHVFLRVCFVPVNGSLAPQKCAKNQKFESDVDLWLTASKTTYPKNMFCDVMHHE